jgi:RNA polymerase sigma-70 factor (ECF subfamily)
MRRIASSHSNNSGLATGSGDYFQNKFQRIFSSLWSHQVEESQMDDADEALVRQSQSGDPKAFECLIVRHQRMIYSLTYRMTGSAADAEDLAQETFVRAYRNIGSYRAVSKFSTWLYRIAINVCLTWRHREARRVEAYANWANMAEVPGSNGESTRGEIDRGSRAHAALLKLPPKQRAAIALTVYEGLNHAEAAKVLGCSETTVSWRVFVARNKLRRWLSAERE